MGYTKSEHIKNPNQYNGEVVDAPIPHQSAKKMYIESYGCQMNFSDSEIVASILGKVGYATTNELEDADRRRGLDMTVSFVSKSFGDDN